MDFAALQFLHYYGIEAVSSVPSRTPFGAL